MRRFLQGLTAVVLLSSALATPARAELVDYGDGLIYDTVQDLTWLDLTFEHPEHQWMLVDGSCVLGNGCDWNYTWTGANAWTQNLTYAGFDDWRLPAIVGPSRSELTNMLEQIGWTFYRESDRLPLGHDEYADHYYVSGGQGPFQYPLQYYYSWLYGHTGYYHSGFDGPFDFPDNWDSFAGNIYAVREGAPVHQVPELSTLSAAMLGIASLVAVRRRQRR